ncbi:MAG: PAS domain S-box protein [Alphaproteobacteria bacterium]|nr:PAS domain S-box protein [Alphaproteobacteria bacterium]
MTILVVVVSGTLGWNLYADYRRGVLQAQETSANLADAFAVYASLFFKRTDADLRGLARDLEPRAAQGPMTAAEFQQVTARRLPRDGSVRFAWIRPSDGPTGNEGRRTEVVGFLPSGMPNVEAADVYAGQVAGDVGLVVGSSRRDAASGEWFLLLSRRVNDADGRFRGTLVASIPDVDLYAFYKSMQAGRSGAAILARTDGLILARHPFSPQVLGTSLAQAPLFAEHLPRAPAGTFRAVTQTDSVERFVSYRQLQGLPLVVAVGVATSDALADFFETVWLYAALWIVLVVATIAALWVFLKSDAMRGLAEMARAKALDRMRQIARRLRVTQDTLAEAIVTFDATGRLEGANRAARQTFGFSRGDLGDRPFWQLVRSTGRSGADPMAGLVASAGTVSEVVAVRGDGSAFPAELRVSAFELDGRQLYTASLIDLSERREAVRQAQINESRFRAVFDASSQGMTLLRPDGVIFEVNAPLLTRTGVPRDMLVGKPAWEAPWWRLLPDGAAWLREAVRTAAAGELVQKVFATIDRTGRSVKVDYILQPIRNRDGEIVYLLAEARDVTDLALPRT